MQLSIFQFFVCIVYDNRLFSIRTSPCGVPFGSNTFLKSELVYQCLIFQVIGHYGQFQNGRLKIHDFHLICIIKHGFLKFNIINTVLVSNLTFYRLFKLQMLVSDIYHRIQDSRQKMVNRRIVLDL